MGQSPVSGPLAFVNELALPPAPAAAPRLRAAAAPAQTPGKSASVAGNSLMAFTADVSAQHKDDLLNSFGLAQLAASKEGYDAARDPLGYYRKVTTILSNIGYTGQSITFADYQTTTKTVEIDKVVLEIMGSLLTAPELEIVKAAVNALKSSADAGGAPWQIYSSHSTHDNNGSFSVGLANETNGNVAVKLSAFHFTGTATSTKFLWMSYSSTSVQIQEGQTELVLNDSVYGRIRETVANKMGAHAQSYVANLPAL